MIPTEEFRSLVYRNMQPLGPKNPDARRLPWGQAAFTWEDVFTNAVRIEKLVTSVKHRRKGEATRLMARICELADRACVFILLQPQPIPQSDGSDEGLCADKDSLRRFYGRFGFRDLEEDPQLMIRTPECREAT